MRHSGPIGQIKVREELRSCTIEKHSSIQADSIMQLKMKLLTYEVRTAGCTKPYSVFVSVSLYSAIFMMWVQVFGIL